MKKIGLALKRFNSSDLATKKRKISNRIYWILRTHRYVIWNVSKTLGIKELKTNKYETFFVPTRDSTISKHLFISGQFDIEKLLKVSKILNIKNKTLIDVGANLGSICIPACKRKLVIKSIAIEPDKVTFKYLNRNIIENQINSITTINAVVGKNKSSAIFGSKADNPGDSKVVNSLNEFEFLDIYSVNQISLNSLIDDLNPLETIIWIDVQGYEPLVLQGATEFTDRATPLVLEVFPLGINQYSNFLELEQCLSNYTKYANLKFDMPDPYYEPMENFKKDFINLENSGGYTDFLFI